MRALAIFLAFATILFADIKEHLVQANGEYVIDKAGILSQNTKSAINALLLNLDKNSTNQVVVMTINSLQGYDIEEFANEQARYLGAGQKAYNNGVLLLVAMDERRVRIEVGYGLEGVLTDMVCKKIIDYRILPHFRNKAYENGVISGVLSILDVIESGDIKFDPINSNGDPSNIDFIIFLIFFIIILIAMTRAKSGSNARRNDTEIISNFPNDLFGNRSRGGFGGGNFRGSSSRDGGFSGGGGSFGGGGASGSW